MRPLLKIERPAVAQRIGSIAAGFGKTRLRKITSSAKLPLHTLTEGGQVEPVLDSLKENIKMLGGYDKYLEVEPFSFGQILICFLDQVSGGGQVLLSGIHISR